MKRHHKLNRRRLLQAVAATSAGAAIGGGSCWKARNAHADEGDGPYFLIVMCAFGGGAIIDSYLPVAESEAHTPSLVDCFPDDQIWTDPSSPIRIADAKFDTIGTVPFGEMELPLSPIAGNHLGDTMVTTVQHTSVNHTIGQHRSLTGGGAWGGRTLSEAVALAYGDGFALPNVNMASLGFLLPGDDDSLPSRAFAEAVASPLLKPLSFSSHKGQPGVPDRELIDIAREMRNKKLDPETAFYQTFRNSERLKLWKRQREDDAPPLEADELIDKLIFVNDTPQLPLSEFGLQASPEADRLVQLYPDIIDPGVLDPFHQQCALAYLLLKYGVSVTVTISPDYVLRTSPTHPLPVSQPTLAFDGAHGDHRSAQALMWWRMLDATDKLIGLLKDETFDEDTGETMWDRTMIHFAPDFGRDKRRLSPDTWGTSHHLNNGTVTISPLVNGNTVLGGVVKNDSPDTDCHTYGFDLVSGAEDEGRQTAEGEHYAGLLQALNIDTSAAGLPDVPAMRKQS